MSKLKRRVQQTPVKTCLSLPINSICNTALRLKALNLQFLYIKRRRYHHFQLSLSLSLSLYIYTKFASPLAHHFLDSLPLSRSKTKTEDEDEVSRLLSSVCSGTLFFPQVIGKRFGSVIGYSFGC